MRQTLGGQKVVVKSSFDSISAAPFHFSLECWFSGALKLADTVTKITVAMCFLRKSVRGGTRGENAVGP